MRWIRGSPWEHSLCALPACFAGTGLASNRRIAATFVLVFANLDPVVPSLVFERVGADGVAVLRDREILPEVTRRLVGDA